MSISRRQVLTRGAWIAPAVVLSAPASAAAASTPSPPPPPPPPPPSPTHSAGPEFVAQNPNGPWSYLAVGAGEFSLTPATGASNPWASGGFPTVHGPNNGGYPSVALNNTSDSGGFPTLGGVDGWDPGTLCMHPDNSGYAAAVRFTTPAPGGTFQIEARFKPIDTTGGGGEAFTLITPSGSQSGAADASGDPALTTLTAVETLAPGDIVEVRVSAAGNYFNDSTQVDLELTEV